MMKTKTTSIMRRSVTCGILQTTVQLSLFSILLFMLGSLISVFDANRNISQTGIQQTPGETNSDNRANATTEHRRTPQNAYPSSKVIRSASRDHFPVHIFRFYLKPPVKPTNSLCFLDCLGLLSIMMYFKPVEVYFHTNYPKFWPFDSCNKWIKDWSSVIPVYYKKPVRIGGRKIKFPHHAADYAKLTTVYKYGGLSVDFDVYMLPGIREKVFKVLNNGSFECMVSQENSQMFNMGFTACWNGSRYAEAVLDLYDNDYRPNEFLYNSGQKPLKVYRKMRRRGVYVDHTIADTNGDNRDHMWIRYGIYDWRKRTAYHSFYHDCNFTEETAWSTNTSQAELFRFILDSKRTHSY